LPDPEDVCKDTSINGSPLISEHKTQTMTNNSQKDHPETSLEGSSAEPGHGVRGFGGDLRGLKEPFLQLEGQVNMEHGLATPVHRCKGDEDFQVLLRGVSVFAHIF
jgi:hypothetical protein